MSSEQEKVEYDPNEWVTYSIHISDYTVREIKNVVLRFFDKNIDDKELATRRRALEWLTNQLVLEVTYEQASRIGVRCTENTDLTFEYFERINLIFNSVIKQIKKRELRRSLRSELSEFHIKYATNPNISERQLGIYLTSEWREYALTNPILPIYLLNDPQFTEAFKINIAELVGETK